MKLRDVSQRIRPQDQVDFIHTLKGEQALSELREEQLADFPSTIYIANSQGLVFGKVEKEMLLYLMERQHRFPFEQILDNMGDGVVAVDSTGRIFYANPAYESVLGVPLRRVLGRMIQDVEPGSLLGQTLEKRTPLMNEKQLIVSIKKYVSLRTFPLWNGETFLGAVSVFKDVTRLHQLNQEMRRISGIMDEYSQRIRSLETAEKLEITSYNQAFQNTIQKAATVALTDVPLLIYGESGTGKNTMARYLHQCSSRREKPLIVVNCAAIPPDMIEEELFGDEDRQKTGKYMLADGGTLFLDEIGELPLAAQSHLLRFLQQDRDVYHAGKCGEYAPDIRLIASSSQPLERLVQDKHFRKELFFVLNTITVSLPPLRERRDDIVPITNRFLAVYNEKYHRNVVFSAHTYQEIQKYDWPGNFWELKSYVERAVILADDNVPVFGRMEEKNSGKRSSNLVFVLHDDEPLAHQVRAFEAEVIRTALASCGGNRTAAMKKLGISRRTFYRKCAELRILSCGEK